MKGLAHTKKQRYAVVTAAALVVLQLAVAASFFGWMNPASVRGGSAGKKRLELEQKLAGARTMISQKETFLEEMEAGIARLESLAVYAPDSSDRYAWAYEYISLCATRSQVFLDSLEEVSGTEAGAPAPFYTIRVSAHCRYEPLIEFLRHLELGNPLLRIRQVTTAAIEGEPQAHRVRVLMQWPATVPIERGLP